MRKYLLFIALASNMALFAAHQQFLQQLQPLSADFAKVVSLLKTSNPESLRESIEPKNCAICHQDLAHLCSQSEEFRYYIRNNFINKSLFSYLQTSSYPHNSPTEHTVQLNNYCCSWILSASNNSTGATTLSIDNIDIKDDKKQTPFTLTPNILISRYFPKVTTLHLTGVQLTNTDLDKITLPTIIYATFSNNNLTQFPFDFARRHQQLASLYLGENNITTLSSDEDIQKLQQANITFPTIGALVFNNNKLTTIEAPDFYKLFPKLESLDVQHNNIRKLSVSALQGLSQLTRLKLIDNPLESFEESILNKCPLLDLNRMDMDNQLVDQWGEYSGLNIGHLNLERRTGNMNLYRALFAHFAKKLFAQNKELQARIKELETERTVSK